MIAANHDRRLHLAASNELVEREPDLRPVTVPKPTDARRQTLELHAFLRELDPATQIRIVRNVVEHDLVGRLDVRRIAGERDPTERTLADTEQRPNVRRDEARDLERSLRAGLDGTGSNVVSVIENLGAFL